MAKIKFKSRLILWHRGKTLLLKQTRANGGNYSLIGGTVEKKEFAKGTLIRESLEEAGIVLRKKDLVLAHVLHKRGKKKHTITLYFKALRWEGMVETREPHKFKKVEWFPLNNLPTNLTSTVRHVFEKYREGDIYSEFTK